MGVDNHRLQPLLAPRSIALVGASERVASVGNMMLTQLIERGYAGPVYPVNPRYQTLNGLQCYPSLAELPGTVDLAVLNVAGHRIEALMREALDLGIEAFVIFDPCQPLEDTSPRLLDRLRSFARETGVAICGGNGMGFSNFDAKCFVGMWLVPPRPSGSVSLIAHSGSVFGFANAPTPNYFNLSVSAGQEIGTAMDEYMDYSLAMPSTRAIALFAESVRNPDGFQRSLAKAREREIPVLVCKLGRTDIGIRQALSHTGAIAGDSDAFDALLDHYDAIKVDSLDGLLAAATLLASAPSPVGGGFAMSADSGGLSGLAADRAEPLGLDFPALTEETTTRLKELMPLATPANPLDAVVLAGPGFWDVYHKAHELMIADPNVGLYCVDSYQDDRYADLADFMTGDAALQVFATTEKPMFLMSSYTGLPQERLREKCLAAGAPFVLGTDNALVAARSFLDYHERLRRPPRAAEAADPKVCARWRDAVVTTPVLGEHQALSMFADFGLPVVDCELVDSAEAALEAAETLGFPVVLKTAVEGIHHKSDVDGVYLGLTNRRGLEDAYESLRSRLGPSVLVSAMVEGGVEMAAGLFTDPTAGQVIALGPGGTLVEYFDERVYAIPPFDAVHARRLIDQLRFSRVLKGARGKSPANIDALAESLARFSVLGAALAGEVAEIDINPLIAGPKGAIAVDGLVIGHAARCSN